MRKNDINGYILSEKHKDIFQDNMRNIYGDIELWALVQQKLLMVILILKPLVSPVFLFWIQICEL